MWKKGYQPGQTETKEEGAKGRDDAEKQADGAVDIEKEVPRV